MWAIKRQLFMFERLKIKQDDRLFPFAVFLLLTAGILLRASKYLHAWSLRGDELAVTLNLANRTTFDLMTRPLDYEQAAPFGFLLITKALVSLFGQSEYTLRLTAFAAGCISLLLAHLLFRKILRSYGYWFAMIGFAFGNYLIFYSAELKQYSTDVLCCLLLLRAFYQHLSKETYTRDFILLASLGSLTLCFSYPALFVLIGIGIPLLFHHWNHPQKRLWMVLTGTLWAGTFGAIYWLLLRHQVDSTYLITFWANLLSFMPMPPWRDITWFYKAAEGFFSVVAGFAAPAALVLTVYIMGLWGILKEKNWQWALVLTLPLALNVIVSGFYKYPFHGRLILYLVPVLLIVLGKGVDHILFLIRNPVPAMAAFGGLLILFFSSVTSTTNTYLFTYDYVREDLKPVLSFMETNHQDNDNVYLYHFVGPAYLYYAPAYHLENLPYIMGQNHSARAKRYQDEISTLPRGRRIWFVFSFVIQARVRKGERQNEREYILNYLKENGELLTEFYSTNQVSSAHLFILR